MSDTSDETTPAGELLPVGETSTPERTDIRTPDGSGSALTIAETVERYAVSNATLRRKLDAGLVAGAYKTPGPKGEQWLLPVAALEALGYVTRGEPAPTAETSPTALAALEESNARAEALAAKVAELEAELGEKRERLDELTGQVLGLYAERKELSAAALDGAEMAGRLAEIEKRHAAELEAARRRRGIFRRK
jgi:hypothetical protein